MIAKRITRVTLTRTTELGTGELTSYAGIELWRVEWTISSSTGKTEQLNHSVYTEKSARRLVDNLLKQRPDGLPIETVYTTESPPHQARRHSAS
jgi:hypothetical protein